MQSQLKQGRVVAITGAGTGIGRETALQLGALGWQVAIGGRRLDKLFETAHAVRSAGGQCLPVQLDVSDADGVEQFFTRVESEFGTVTAVINNAATARYGPLEDFPASEIANAIATKLTGALYMSRRGIMGMRREGTGGDILFVSSLAAIEPWPLQLAYGAASAGVEQAAKTLELELEGSGIRVSTVRCGHTPGTDLATREIQSGRVLAAKERWFRLGRLRHGNVLAVVDVAATIVAAVTLPPGRKYGVIEVTAAAPGGALPATLEEWDSAIHASAVKAVAE
jgi:NAD(P)-dependent dehydrogenase (short-subunit alcohol dehydrogenase family)